MQGLMVLGFIVVEILRVDLKNDKVLSMSRTYHNRTPKLLRFFICPALASVTR